jgi:hypothetical protein
MGLPCCDGRRDKDDRNINIIFLWKHRRVVRLWATIVLRPFGMITRNDPGMPGPFADQVPIFIHPISPDGLLWFDHRPNCDASGPTVNRSFANGSPPGQSSPSSLLSSSRFPFFDSRLYASESSLQLSQFPIDETPMKPCSMKTTHIYSRK